MLASSSWSSVFQLTQSFHGLHAQIQVLKIWASYVYNNSEREGKWSIETHCSLAPCHIRGQRTTGASQKKWKHIKVKSGHIASDSGQQTKKMLKGPHFQWQLLDNLLHKIYSISTDNKNPTLVLLFTCAQSEHAMDLLLSFLLLEEYEISSWDGSGGPDCGISGQIKWISLFDSHLGSR